MSGRRLLDSLDLPVILTTLALVGVGVFGIASATMEQPSQAGLWRTQVVWLAIGMLAGVVIVMVDYRVWAEIALPMHGFVNLLLVAVLFFGKEVGGNRSWLVLGPLRLQPSELVKWTTCLVLAAYLAQRVRGSLGLRQMSEMGLLVGVPLALIAMQPDFGTALIFLPIYLAALLLGGVRWKVIAGFAIVGILLAPAAWTQLEDYQPES